MLDLNNGVTLLTTEFTARSWPGLGFRTKIKIERLDTESTHIIGPFQYRQEVYKAINRFSEIYPNASFNVYCYGEYIGGTEV